VIAEISDGKTAVAEISRMRPDIVFLDIEMPELSGFDVAAATATVGYQLVFVTAYDHYALEAFGTNAIDYLVKPVRPSLLKKCINKMLHQEELVLESLEEQKARSDSLVLSDGNGVRVVHQTHIAYIEGIGRYRCIHLNKAGTEVHGMNTIISGTTLDDFECQLAGPLFVRVHRSFIVNTAQIIELTVEARRHYLSVIDAEMRIPVSRYKVAELKAQL
jgi:DNA-binding LytR/AlgR family response regulator